MLEREESLTARSSVALTRKESPTAEKPSRVEILKQEMADRLMAQPATEVYDLAPAS